jgi:hypothetical protein
LGDIESTFTTEGIDLKCVHQTVFKTEKKIIKVCLNLSEIASGPVLSGIYAATFFLGTGLFHSDFEIVPFLALFVSVTGRVMSLTPCHAI